MNGHKFDSTEPPVDAPDKLIHSRAEILVFIDILSGGNSKLNQNDLPDPFRMLCKEEFQGVEFLWDTFDVIQSINTDDDFNALETCFKVRYTFDD